MTARGELVAAEARTWIETPFRWQASVKGVGCDCKGLLWGVARELGFPEAESLYAQVADYSPTRPVPSALLKEGIAAIFDPVECSADLAAWLKLEPDEPNYETPPLLMTGDVLLVRPVNYSVQPLHIAIYSASDRAIHAQIGSKNWVKETRLRALLKKYKLHSAWRWRDG